MIEFEGFPPSLCCTPMFQENDDQVTDELITEKGFIFIFVVPKIKEKNNNSNISSVSNKINRPVAMDL